MTNDFTYVVPPVDAGERLDRFLARAAGVGLRAARRMIASGRVRVDAVSRQASWKLGPGQAVTAYPGGGPPGGTTGDIAPPPGPGATPFLIAGAGGFAAFFKPAGLHTAALAGGGGPSLEAMLPELCPREFFPEGVPVLVNRLDRDTSGIVLAALGQDAARAFRTLENQGMVDKRYLAVVEGRLEGSALLDRALDTDGRARTKVLDAAWPDRLRWTAVRPVAPLGGRTLVEARISKGARHQIRAHLAAAGHPLVGDVLYGRADEDSLRLHHWRVSLPGLCAVSLPGWPECSAQIERFAEEYPCEQ